MSALFDDLYEGLQEAISFEKGSGTAKSVTYMIMPVKEYSCEDIKRIRNAAGMTQKVFSNYMGVSPKTVEAWEKGRTHPKGPACRLLDVLDSGKEKELSFISIRH